MLINFDSIINNIRESKRMIPLDVKNYVYKIANDFRRVISLSDFLQQMNSNSRFKKSNSGIYSIQNYTLCVGSSLNMQDSIDNLMFVKKYNISSAPRLMAYSYNINKKYAIMVFDLQYAEPYSSGKFIPNKNGKMQYLSELVNFSQKTGLYNSADIDSENWLITPDGNIILSDWSELKEFSENYSMKEHYENLAQTLNLVLH